ncbi:sigma-54-dependent transcriptional regulator [Methylophaga sp. OBS3]|uniref:sigma-54-dependent transcriptional regulator n=1 Tax=Methylophaga sp. OBS3 TaxID=2991934 RepID=UPI002255EAB2|nr:sigma-54 dependent transcriptional regulator [Methylophaga sp. OBS3]MCX4190786.1 sigma-54 dependent transcriptional regulator [Methylophaga sp. OBS3]
MLEILIIEDEKLFAKSVLRRLEIDGYQAKIAASITEAEQYLSHTEFDLLLLDVRLPDGNGLDLLKRLRASDSAWQNTAVIMMTAYGELEDAVAAMKLGANDYLKKPVDLDELMLTLEKVMQAKRTREQLNFSQIRGQKANEPVNFIGTSDELSQLKQSITHIANMMDNNEDGCPVLLLTGETGSGKELAAKWFHQSGSWREQPFVHVDCTALPTETAEAELFGVAANFASHAHPSRPGLIEVAESGTILLDEISELPLALQAKLLNVLERRVIRRVGELIERPTKAHFVVTSNRDLASLVDEKQFRSDLYYRLNTLEQKIPALRDRKQDIAELAQYFIELYARRYRVNQPRLDFDAMRKMQEYPWPGNVRELSHVLERAVMLAKHEIISSSDLLLDSKPQKTMMMPAMLQDMTLEQIEKYLLSQTLQETGGNVSKSARQLGLSRMAMRYRMEKHGL